ncbi:uncharacterized protein LOC593876 isoform X2 [Strongylocentrotus purpuratus]|uniref:Uncharacterized protein n=1 Tax=Strongylocentrotus purpuratus TaxID=7668 RepID=A0A7M7P4X7_STRPU|nr:uncharacterized protein LOC593876 isoform X2 [Strongylocentrotus purpuratus]
MGLLDQQIIYRTHVSLFHILCCFLQLSSTLVSNTYRTDVLTNHGHHTTAEMQLHRWAVAAMDYPRTLDCTVVPFIRERECLQLVQRPETEMNLYVAPPRPGGYHAVLPDGGLSGSGTHDVVLAIDPYPRASFGHLVIIFFLDFDLDLDSCQDRGGKYLASGECLQLAEKQRCRNRLWPRSGRRRCDINFLPHVYSPFDETREQHLVCRDDAILGFGACPTYRSDAANYSTNCELNKNTRRCEVPSLKVKARCKVYEICDQAVLISGGWNRQTSLQSSADNVRDMYSVLRKNGFRRPNIKTFFADTSSVLGIDEEGSRHTYPATHKMAIQSHLSTLCRTPYCVESLVIYLNSPTLADGTMLLWDTNQDGIANVDEQYTVSEFLEDISDCNARHIYIIADQSFSGRLVDALQLRSDTPHHENVVVFTSGGSLEYSWNSELTNRWMNSNHTTLCVDEIHRGYEGTLSSTPILYESSQNAANTTLFGAPCDMLPFLTPHELRVTYMGCQNLPMTLWWFRFQSTRSTRSTHR